MGGMTGLCGGLIRFGRDYFTVIQWVHVLLRRRPGIDFNGVFRFGSRVAGHM